MNRLISSKDASLTLIDSEVAARYGNAGPHATLAPIEVDALTEELDADMPQSARYVIASELASLYGLMPGAVLGAWIDGRPVEAEGQHISLLDPATGDEVLRYPDSGLALASQAAQGAARAQREWMALPGTERGRRMWNWAQTIRDALPNLAMLDSTNSGQPLATSHAEITRLIECIEYNAGWCDKFDGRLPAPPTGHLAYVAQDPLGVVAGITSWAAPLLEAGWLAGPALAAGNAVILKPSHLTPLSSLVLGLLASEAGLPHGLVQVLPGLGPTTGTAVVGQDPVRKVVYTGDSLTAAQVSRLCAERLKPCVLNLGGRSVNVVFNDADLGAAIRGALRAAFGPGLFRHTGSHLLVQRDLHDEVLARVIAAASRIRLGVPADDTAHLGPMISQRRLLVARALLDRAEADGARVSHGPIPAELPQGGHWMGPAVVSHAPEQSAVLWEPIAAPILSVIPFKDEADALRLVNNPGYSQAQAGAVWTRDPTRAHGVAAAMRTDTVWINGFGAVHASGYGRYSGREALTEYTRSKAVWVGLS